MDELIRSAEMAIVWKTACYSGSYLLTVMSHIENENYKDWGGIISWIFFRRDIYELISHKLFTFVNYGHKMIEFQVLYYFDMKFRNLCKDEGRKKIIMSVKFSLRVQRFVRYFIA